MVLTDGVHLVSDHSLAELHELAVRLTLRRSSFRGHRIPHYDLTTLGMRYYAARLGVRQVSIRELVRRAVRS